MNNFKVKPPSFIKKSNVIRKSVTSIDKPSRIRRGPPHIEEFPNILLLKIFENLSLRDLCSCSLVCKRWHLLTSDDLLWQRLCLPLFNDKIQNYPLVGLKKHVLKKAESARSATLTKILKSTEKKIRFPASVSLKHLRCSLYLEIVNEKKELVLNCGKLLPEIIGQDDITLKVPSKKLSQLNMEEMKEVSLYILVPQFPEHLLSFKESPRQQIVLARIENWSKSTLEVNKSLCWCRELQENHILKYSNVHLCLDHVIFSQWNGSAEMGFLSFFLPLHYVMNAFERLVKRESLLSLPICSAISPSILSDDSLTICDNRVFISWTDTDGKIFLTNTWRSMDYQRTLLPESTNTKSLSQNKKITKDQRLSFRLWMQLVDPSDSSSHIYFDQCPTLRIPCGQFSENIQNSFLMNILVQDNRQRVTFGLKKPCCAWPINNDEVLYGYEGQYYNFQIKSSQSIDKKDNLQNSNVNNKYVVEGTYVYCDEERKFILVNLHLALMN